MINGEGTFFCKIEDDDGIVHPIKTKKALYIPEAPSCLLAPQQRKHQENENHPKPDSTWYATKDRHCALYWNQEWYRRTIPWDTSINVTRIHSEPSSNTYCVLVANYEQEQKREDMEHV